MKLRLEPNSIRLRLKKTEVQNFARTGRIQATIILGEGSHHEFIYVLEASASVSFLQARLMDNGLLVGVPRELAEHWVSSGDVGIESSQPVSKGINLRVLIEKDFACLEGTEEQNVDTFPHPLAGTKC
jgi:hypothetical protein